MTSLEAHNLILTSGNIWIYRAAVIVASLVGGVFVRADSQSWPVPPRNRFLILGVVGIGSLIGCAIPAFFATGLVHQIALSGIITPKTILGGLLFGFLAITLYKRITHCDIETSDAFARGAIA